MSASDYELLKAFINNNTTKGKPKYKEPPIVPIIPEVQVVEKVVEKEVEKIVEKEVPINIKKLNITKLIENNEKIGNELGERSKQICSLYLKLSKVEWSKHFNMGNNFSISRELLYCTNVYNFDNTFSYSLKRIDNGVECLYIKNNANDQRKNVIVPLDFYMLDGEKLRLKMLHFINDDIRHMKERINTKRAIKHYLSDL